MEVRIPLVAEAWAPSPCVYRLALPHPDCRLETHQSLSVALSLALLRLAYGHSAKARFFPAASTCSMSLNSSFSLLRRGLGDASPPAVLTPLRSSRAWSGGLGFSRVLLVSPLLLLYAPHRRSPTLTLHQLFVQGHGLWATLLCAAILRWILKKLSAELPVRGRSGRLGIFRIVVYERARLILIFGIAFTLSVLTNFLYNLFTDTREISPHVSGLEELLSKVEAGRARLVIHKESIRQFLSTHPGARSALRGAAFPSTTQEVVSLLQCERVHHVLVTTRPDDLTTYLTTYSGLPLSIKPDAAFFFYHVSFFPKQVHNSQNVRVLAASTGDIPPELRYVERKQAPAGVMVWAGVWATGRTRLVFVPPGLKINAQA